MCANATGTKNVNCNMSQVSLDWFKNLTVKPAKTCQIKTHRGRDDLIKSLFKDIFSLKECPTPPSSILKVEGKFVR